MSSGFKGPLFGRPTIKKGFSTEALNTIILEIDGVLGISGQIATDGAFNGRIEVQIQKQDGTWAPIFNVQTINTTQNFMCSQWSGGSLLVAGGLEKYPFNFRFQITTHATLGSGTITISPI